MVGRSPSHLVSAQGTPEPYSKRSRLHERIHASVVLPMAAWPDPGHQRSPGRSNTPRPDCRPGSCSCKSLPDRISWRPIVGRPTALVVDPALPRKVTGCETVLLAALADDPRQPWNAARHRDRLVVFRAH